jgi:hypothetical protein
VYINPHMAGDMCRHRQDDLRRASARSHLLSSDRVSRLGRARPARRRAQFRRLLASVVSRIDAESRYLGAAGRTWI